jgi:DNA invertase Pin-like site-specific DNA recombinase
VSFNLGFAPSPESTDFCCTSPCGTVANQIEALSKIAEHRGWEVVATYADNGISGAKGRKDRPGLDALLNDAQRGKFNIVMAWAIDRIGRSLIDLLGTIQHLEACGCDLYLDQQAIDTTTPAGKLMFQICGAFGEFERGMIRERINAGLARARKAGKVLGRKPGTVLVDRGKLARARKLLAAGTGILKTARAVGLGTGTVHRLKQSMG